MWKPCLAVLATAHSALAFGAEKALAPPNPGHALLQTLLGLALVVVLILGLAWFAKRFNLGGLQGRKHMTTLAVLPLGTREKAILVDVAGQQILLGVAPGRVTALHVFPEPVVDLSAEASDQTKRSARIGEDDFAKKLSEILRQGVKG